MKNANIKRLKQLGLAVLGAYVISGCPSSSTTSDAIADSLLTANPDPSVDIVAQPVVAQSINEAAADNAATEIAAVTFEVCAAVDSWQRPTEDEQAKQLGADSRYRNVATDDALKRASTQFWDHQAISFTTYGLSARMEPVMLSGLWTVADELWDCYAPETTVAINEGELAETWLFNQQITGIQQAGDRYVMTVESAPTGVQVIQFERSDQSAELPLDIVNVRGESVGVVSGDWQ